MRYRSDSGKILGVSRSLSSSAVWFVTVAHRVSVGAITQIIVIVIISNVDIGLRAISNISNVDIGLHAMLNTSYQCDDDRK